MKNSLRSALFIAFAFAVMADPVSSVAYAIEAALGGLDGQLSLLPWAMGLVVLIVALVIANYWFLVARFPEGGGDAAAIGKAFGEGWAFPPIGALIVDFALTIAISVAAAASAVVNINGSLTDWRIPIALVLCGVVAFGTWFGHLGRLVFALFTVLFIVAAALVLFKGFVDPVGGGAALTVAQTSAPDFTGLIAVVIAFPVAMALATGVEAPLTAIAQLGQLDNDGRRRYGRGTLVLTLAIVGSITLGLALLAVKLDVGLPGEGKTMIGNLAEAAAGQGFISTFFNLSSAILLLSAASSSFAAGPGLLKALSRTPGHLGILPAGLGKTNSHHTPYWSVVVFLAASSACVVAARADEQELVLFYAVAVFISFLCGLAAMTRFSLTERFWPLFALNTVALVAVAFTLVVNLFKGFPLASLAAALLIAGGLWWMWVRAGRPTGVSQVEVAAGEEFDEQDVLTP